LHLYVFFFVYTIIIMIIMIGFWIDTNSRNISFLPTLLQFHLYQLLIILTIPKFNNLIRCPTNRHKPFLRTPLLNRHITPIYLRPTLLQQHHPYLLSMWICIYRYLTLTWKIIIRNNHPPLSINKQPYPIIITWVSFK